MPSLGPNASGDALYRFEAPELKAANHRLDGAFWPRSAESGTPERPVVLLEVQMHAKAGFKHRLFAQTARFLQLHPQVQHLAPVRPEAELRASTQQILNQRPDLLSAVLPMLFERFPMLTPEEIMVIASIPTDQLLHTRAAQDLLDRGREEGRQEGEVQGEARGRAAEAAAGTLRLLNRRCGPLSDATTARIQALPLQQLEALAVGEAFSAGVALLDFSGPADLAVWLVEHVD